MYRQSSWRSVRVARNRSESQMAYSQLSAIKHVRSERAVSLGIGRGFSYICIVWRVARSTVRIARVSRYLCLLEFVQTGSGVHPPSHSEGTGVIFWG
jgi:hypothetical protein